MGFTNHRVNLDPVMAYHAFNDEWSKTISTLLFIAKKVPEQIIYCELDP